MRAAVLTLVIPRELNVMNLRVVLGLSVNFGLPVSLTEITDPDDLGWGELAVQPSAFSKIIQPKFQSLPDVAHTYCPLLLTVIMQTVVH